MLLAHPVWLTIVTYCYYFYDSIKDTEKTTEYKIFPKLFKRFIY